MADTEHYAEEVRDHVTDYGSHHAHRALDPRRRTDLIKHFWPELVVSPMLISGPNLAQEPCARRGT